MISASGYQRVNGLKLYVHRFRDPDVAPSSLTVLLLHGFMDAGSTWEMVAEPLARAGHDVVAPDLRGFGLSDYVGAGGYYHFPDYVADLAELVEALAPRRLAIVGHSMGGTVAALYAGAKPASVERLVLLEGLGPVATPPALAIDRMQAWLRDLRDMPKAPKHLTGLQEAIERLALHHPRVAREIIESRAKLLTRADDAGRLIWAYDPLHRTTSPTPFQAEAFKEFLARIECPTLVVSGGLAGWHPPGEAERIASLKHAVQHELPNAGHMMHWTEPKAVADRLLAFFAEPLPARPAGAKAPGKTGSPAQTIPGQAPISARETVKREVTDAEVTSDAPTRPAAKPAVKRAAPTIQSAGVQPPPAPVPAPEAGSPWAGAGPTPSPNVPGQVQVQVVPAPPAGAAPVGGSGGGRPVGVIPRTRYGGEPEGGGGK